jgi:hypothetical protein
MEPMLDSAPAFIVLIREWIGAARQRHLWNAGSHRWPESNRGEPALGD